MTSGTEYQQHSSVSVKTGILSLNKHFSKLIKREYWEHPFNPVNDK